MTKRLTFDNLNLMNAERAGFDASVWRALSEIRNDLNEREKLSMVSPDLIPVPLDFLEPDKDYKLELHKDGRNKDEIVTETAIVNSGTVLNIRVIEDGGFCGVLSPVSE